MKKLTGILFISMLIFACKGKKSKLGEEDVIDVSEFIEFFNEIKLPYQLGDTAILRKNSDSSISYKIFTQFIPDSILSKQFGKSAKPIIYPLGKVVVKNNETYLFIKAITAAKKLAFIIAFDKDDKFSAALPFVSADKNVNTSASGNMDTRYTITTVSQNKLSKDKIVYNKDVYVYNSAGAFTLILTESNDEKRTAAEVSNPIDTFPKQNKLSGDYLQDKLNYISVRDGKTESQLLFFIHFEKDKGLCKGEIKGIGKIENNNKVVFTDASSPCALEFNFNGNRVSVKETGACGSYRDIKCFFEGSFARKAAAAKKTKKKK
jgi:hypothetical protein